MFPILETERLILREIVHEDASDIFAYFSNEDVVKHYGMQALEQVEQAEQLIEGFAKNFQGKRGMRWGITVKGENRLIGTIGFNLWVPAHKRAEVGYEIHPDFWRMGYASEALEKVVEYGFQKLGLTRIGATVYIENTASNQMLLKQGFEKEGTFRNYMYQDDCAHDVHIYAKVTL
ncbi:GNAT family protein [Metasolibacillus meyeri]|uniref:GNAT family protein n=1 Tax=Metasolibacillus meyeri TaxID=1071052 RepID=A0AAW9NRZ2_9BACL|nr:GNAT family protein [Metasolibacillus meyeri]MEC1177190.1 GNAT family protein [Metasolibacillus meyeri]